VQDQKTFLNMVVHDLRNPVESIHEGLTIAKNNMNNKLAETIE
jgi:hypothetical protein